MANQVQKIMVITMGVRDRLYRQGTAQIMQQNALAWKALRKQAIVKLPSAKLEAHPTPLGKEMAMGN